MTWFANDGGPLLALDAAAAPQWAGAGEPPAEGISPGSDYARACEADYPADLVQVGDSQGVVLGAQDHVSTARWFQGADPTVIFLVGCIFGDEATDLALFEQLVQDRAVPWGDLGLVAAPSGQLLLLHAACSGIEVTLDPGRDLALIGDAVSQSVLPGRYQLSAAEARVRDDGLYCVVRWVLTR